MLAALLAASLAASSPAPGAEAAAPAAAAARAEPEAEPLTAGVRIAAHPAEVRLGVDQRVALELTAPPGALQVSASAGTIADLREISPGRWTAVWQPPRTRVPSVAIVLARAPGAIGFASLRLWGEGRAQVRTRPRAVVEVKIADMTFGPMRADAEGLATVPVVVPPGVDFATQGARKIDLHVPRTKTLAVAPLALAVDCDGDRALEVAVAVVARDGAPREGAPLGLAVTRGRIGALRQVAPGLYAARWELPAGAPGVARLRASLSDQQEAEEVSVRLRGGPAARIELSPLPPSAEAGGAPLQVTARALDARGNPSEEPLRFAVSAGAVEARTAGPGAWSLSVELPGPLGGASSMRLEASPAARAQPLASAEVPLVPGAPAQVEVRAERASVRADGHSAVGLRLTVLDRFGNRVDAAPRLSATAGSVSEPVAAGDAFGATFVAPLLHEAADAVVDVRAGPAEGRTRLTLLPDVRPLSLSARLGWLTDFRGLNASLLGLESSFRTDRLILSLDAAWSSTSSGGPVAGPAPGFSLAAHDDLLLASATAALRLPLGDRVLAWAGAGALLAAVSARVRVDRQGLPSSQTTSRGAAPGAELIAGVERSMWRGVPFLEARLFATRRFSLPNLEGALVGATLSAGYRFEIPWR